MWKLEFRNEHLLFDFYGEEKSKYNFSIRFISKNTYLTNFYLKTLVYISSETTTLLDGLKNYTIYYFVVLKLFEHFSTNIKVFYI